VQKLEGRFNNDNVHEGRNWTANNSSHINFQ